MSLIAAESFDHCTTVTELLSGKFNGGVTSASITPATAAARYGPNGLRLTGSNLGLYWDVTSATTYILGAAVRRGASSAERQIMQFTNGTTRQLELYAIADGTVQVRRNATILDTSAVVLGTNWHYIEWKATVADAGGTCVVKVDGTTVINFTGDTNNSGTVITRAGLSCFQGSASFNVGTIDFDDAVCISTSGDTPTDFIGDIRVAALLPDGAGNSTDMTPNTGANYAACDEATPDEDTTYVSTATNGHKDTYALESLPSTATTIYGVQTISRSRKDDAGARTLRLLTRTNSTDYESGDLVLADAYGYHKKVYSLNPNSSAAWTNANITALQAGVKLQA